MFKISQAYADQASTSYNNKNGPLAHPKPEAVSKPVKTKKGPSIHDKITHFEREDYSDTLVHIREARTREEMFTSPYESPPDTQTRK